MTALTSNSLHDELCEEHRDMLLALLTIGKRRLLLSDTTGKARDEPNSFAWRLAVSQ